MFWLFLLSSWQMNATITIYLLVKQLNGVKSRYYLLSRRSIVFIWEENKYWNEIAIQFSPAIIYSSVHQAGMKIFRSSAFDIQQLELSIWVYRQWIGCHVKRHNDTTIGLWLSFVWCVNCYTAVTCNKWGSHICPTLLLALDIERLMCMW